MARARDKVAQTGFWDEQVAQPKHDEICKWAYENADHVLATLYPEQYAERDWNDEERKGDNALKAAFLDSNPRPKPHVVKRTWEYPLHVHTGYNNAISRPVGFGDLLFMYAIPRPKPTYNYDTYHSQRGHEVTGYEIAWERHAVLLEVKSTLPTLGELLRQLNLYATAFSHPQAVIAPDDAYATILREQGYGFIKYIT